MPEKKTYLEFAKSIKEKYPEYKDVDDHELAAKMVEKYPEYNEQISFDEVGNATEKKSLLYKLLRRILLHSC